MAFCIFLSQPLGRHVLPNSVEANIPPILYVAPQTHQMPEILTQEKTGACSSPYKESIKCMRNEAGPFAISIPISPAMPNIDNAEAVASKAREGSTATKAEMSAVTEHPVAVMFCIIGTPFEAPTTLFPSVIMSTAPDTATTASLA